MYGKKCYLCYFWKYSSHQLHFDDNLSIIPHSSTNILCSSIPLMLESYPFNTSPKCGIDSDWIRLGLNLDVKTTIPAFLVHPV